MHMIPRSVFLLLSSVTLVTASYSATPATSLPKALKNPHPRVIDIPPRSLPRFSAQEQESNEFIEAPVQATATPKSTTSASEGFDAVPPAYREAIAERLQVTSELVRLGRAYDYRSKTTTQLQEILRSLRSESSHTPTQAIIALPPPPPVLNDSDGTWVE